MKRLIFIFVFVLSAFLLNNTPTYGEPFLELDQTDPVDDPYILTPGLALNAEMGGSSSSFQMAFDGVWTINKTSGIKGAFIVSSVEYDFNNYNPEDYKPDGFYAGLTLFRKTGPFYMEIGPSVNSIEAINLHTGLNGFFPITGHSGPTFETNFDICLYPDRPFSGFVKGGWMWLFGDHSQILIGCGYDYWYGMSNLTINPKLGLVEISVDDKLGPFLFDGKVQWALLDGNGPDANISVSYMPIHWLGIGVDYILTTNSIGGVLKVRL